MFGLEKILPYENEGEEIVLTSSWVEMSDFKLNPFIAFTGSFPYFVPLKLLRRNWYPPTPELEDGSAKFAPYGLRKLQALLEREGREVVACTPSGLKKFVGKRTKVVGISTMDPLGMGFVSRTYTSILGFKQSISAAEFLALLRSVRGLKRKYGFKLVVGGAGVWQIPTSGLQEKLGIDTVVVGEVEGVIGEFEKILRGEQVPKVIYARRAEMEEVPEITAPSLFGVVEITRGCGKGCQFCSPTMRKFYSFPLEKILKEARLNAGAGTRMITLQTDDIFLYHHLPRFVPNREKIVRLIREVARVGGVELLQIAHASLPPVVYDPKLVEEIAPTLVEKSRWRCRGRRVASFEVGIETGSLRLLGKYMRGKALPLRVEDWCEIVVEAIDILNDNDIYPLATLLVGLPGETEEDVADTLELLNGLRDKGIFFVPLLFTPEEECMLRRVKEVHSEHLGELYWEFFGRCWRHNVRVWSPGSEEKLKAVAPLYPLYYKWRFGSRAWRAYRILAGFEDSTRGVSRFSPG
jgi:radical SAM superfamily enzyme YgiQ (UPF0313 family)